MLRSSLSLGNEAPEKADEKIGRKVGRGTLGVERRGEGGWKVRALKHFLKL